MNFGRNAIEWLKSYLTNRTQQVKFDQTISDSTIVEAGVPQGSILGPILFIAFTADLSSHMADCVIKAYADDTQFLVEANTIDELKTKLENVIAQAQLWYTKNYLKINPSKTEVVIFGQKRKSKQQLQIKITEDDTTKYITTKRSIKLLGVTLDEDITWEDHIRKVRGIVCRTTANLARTCSVIPLRSRRQLYDALVVPHLNYCDVVWGGLHQKHANTIQRAANFGAKSLLGLKKRTSSTDALIKLQMIPQTERRKVNLGVFVHKLRNESGSTELLTIFKERTERRHTHNTRSAKRGDATMQAHRTSRNKRSSLYRAFKVWNSIPIHIRSIEDTRKFKNSFQNHLLQNFINDNASRTTSYAA